MERRPAPGRPRPLADPVVGALAQRPEEIARRWLIVLLEARPLDEAASVPVAEFAGAAPGLCAAVLDAVGSDDALDRLAGPATAQTFAALAGSREGPAIVAAAESLRRAVSEAAADELARSETDVLAGLTDRLAHTCARLAAAAIATARGSAAGAPVPAAAGDRPPTSGPPAAGDRLPGAGDAGGRGDPVDLAAARAAGRPGTPPPDGSAPLWLAALERQLAQGGRFGLLLVELDGADRLRLAEGETAARDLFGRTGRAVRGAVRRIDLLAHEEDGRMWVIAPDAGRAGAEALAHRVADAVEGSATVRGAPLTVSVGLALYPDDGRDAASLTGHAEETALAARAAGVRIAGAPPDEAAAPGPRLVR